ncbi:cyanophycin synthetase family protein [Denitrobacterium detoxificans]|uniref:Cyanophycin synthase-like N-terminal domain-containing protein n=1 Tax=Denitrobacterium detoxificans TaxID=79604 RepID=A0A1H8QDN5_9ACTN|nr:hypothetical protein [Denitrobacterium detoxificans]SEO51883.1 hypothetical protein SAMN02910314_00424 [Denitrobacterium detoxificans]
MEETMSQAPMQEQEGKQADNAPRGKHSVAGLPLVIDHITVRSDRMVCRVRVSPALRYTTPGMAHRALEKMPSLAHHSCVNENGDTFASAIEHTPLPHLLEHVTIDLLTQRTERSDYVYAGVTEWLDEERGVARVQVSMLSDIESFAAFRDAANFINNLIVGA